MNEQLSTLFQSQDKNGLFKFKQKAWDRLQEVGLPDAKNETYQYVRLRKLFEKPLKKASIFTPVHKENTIVIGPGFVTFPEIKGVTILPLKEAIEDFSTLLQNQFSRFIKEERDPFALMNGALYAEGVLVYVSPKAVLDKPLIVEYFSQDDSFLVPKVHFFFGKESKGDIIERNCGKKGIVNALVDFNLEERSIVTYTQMALNNEGWVFDFTRVLMKENSQFTSHLVTNGSETVRYDYSVQLKGEGGVAHLNGLWMLNASNEAHVHVLMEHAAPYCESLQHFKGALDGSSRSSFEGKILVRKEAQKTNSFQMNNNLLLSPGAQANSKPNLEIFADDVKASHGSTVGQLDDEELFYLRTRGYTKIEAEGILTQGFLREIIEKIDQKEIKDEALQAMGQFLKR